MDRLLSLGEIYSTIFLTNYLKKNGVNAYGLSYLENGIETNENFGEANIISVSAESYLRYFKDHEVLVVPGFIASTLISINPEHPAIAYSPKLVIF